jgi:hypothetical protein
VLYPHENQAALLFDRRLYNFDEVAAQCGRLLAATYGVPFNQSERVPGAFARFYGGDELMVTVEYIDGPPNHEIFAQALGSAITSQLCPDMPERLARARAMILINVNHGVFGQEIQDQFGAMFAEIGFPRQGATLPQFKQRLKVLANLSRLTADMTSPSVVHWTQSNQLFPGDKWDSLAGMDAPSFIHVHPFLFGPGDPVDGKYKLGIRTFGARHFIGHELLIEPHEIAWAANYDVVLTFLTVATLENGYIIPDGDTFGPEDGSLSYRVRHRAAEPDDVPLIELTPLLHRGAGFVSPCYVPKERTIDDRSPPPALMPDDDNEKERLAEEWREKRRLAEGIGGRLEVRAKGNMPLPPASRSRLSLFGDRAIFGRKRG